ncbi:MAG: APC family permease [bacterium]
MSKNLISLTNAILFCTSITIGAGVYLNPKTLVGIAGPFCFVGYLIAALILLPMVLSIAELTRFQPVSGGVYVYSKEYLNSTMGFLSAWSYFIAKSVSLVFILHNVVFFVQSHIPSIMWIPTFFLDYCALAFLIILNIAGVFVAGKIQYVFITLKMIPIVFAFICGFVLFDTSLFSLPIPHASSFLQTIPVSLYAIVGFEVICSIGGFIQNPATNIRKAILSSFAVVVGVCTVFTLLLYAMLGPEVATSHNALLMLGQKLGMPMLGKVINGIVFASLIGGAFGILTGNCWNLHTLAHENYFPFKSILTKINKYHVPWVSLIIEGLISMFVITITAQQLPLQNMAVFATFICYFITALAAFKAFKIEKNASLPRIVPAFAMITCGGVIIFCLKNIYAFGISCSFITVFLVGCLLAIWKKYFRPQS